MFNSSQLFVLAIIFMVVVLPILFSGRHKKSVEEKKAETAALSGDDREVVEEIDAALRRVSEGTYGECEMCREEGKARSKSMIPKARLKAIPYARNCVACEQKREEFSL